MKKHPFVLLPLAAVMASVAHAETTPVVQLASDHFVVNRQGTKVQTNVVTLKEKDARTETDLRGLLSDEPAIEFGGGNGTSQFIAIRGMGQNSVDLKIDDAYSDSQILYHQGRHMLDPELVKIVSVQKGAGSASAGIGATNGAIVAKTVEAQDLLVGSDKNYGAKVGFGYASNNEHSYKASVFGKTGNVDALVAYNRVNSKNYDAGGAFKNGIDDKSYVPYSGLDKVGLLAKVGVNLDNHRFVLSHMKNTNKGVRTVREEFTVDDRKVWNAQKKIWEDNRTSAKRQVPAYREISVDNTNLEWTASNLGFADTAKANAYVMNNKRYSADDSGCGYCGNIAGETTTTIKTKGLNLNLDSTVQDTLVKYGINYRNQEVQPHTFFENDVNAAYQADLARNPNKKHKYDGRIELRNPNKTDVGVYAEAIKDIGNLTLTAGLRYDRFDFEAVDGKKVSDSAINPSFGVIYQATPELSLSATHNYASRSPRLYDALLAHSKPNRGVTTIADGTVAEKAKNTEIGFNYKAGNVTVDGSYFWQKIDDALANPQNRHEGQDDKLVIKQITNAGYIKNHGYELGVSYKDRNWTARAGVAQSKPRLYDTHKDKLLSANPEFAVQTGRTWTGSLAYQFNEPNLELGARVRVVEGASESVLARDTAPTIRDAYNTGDIFANWKPYGNDTLNVNFAVNNIANKLYYPHSQRGTTLPAVGRDFRVGVNYKF
ncbi:TonB-dependent siderophore receptor [Moraxella nasovis]|uniref:TonB-dependent siderophore receptor n=1 Tax=Moraxella nasovis TaxID=2904121 RepID=UPI001F614590|nr:TonB-dependent siderophore receptor [Moraxella nasovis]UNU72824.1 TonB-dependent siderophore receptor [Moraxella nasovis]